MRDTPPRPGRNLGLGRESTFLPGLNQALSLATVRSDRAVALHSRLNKVASVESPLKP
jgi:hypothetical protein